MDGTLPFSPHGEAYVDGGLSDSAPRLPPSIGVTLSPLRPSAGRRAVSSTARHRTFTSRLDDSPRVPPIAPRLAGMRVYLSRDTRRHLARRLVRRRESSRIGTGEESWTRSGF